jgi:hypothetical protein
LRERVLVSMLRPNCLENVVQKSHTYLQSSRNQTTCCECVKCDVLYSRRDHLVATARGSVADHPRLTVTAKRLSASQRSGVSGTHICFHIRGINRSSAKRRTLHHHHHLQLTFAPKKKTRKKCHNPSALAPKNQNPQNNINTQPTNHIRSHTRPTTKTHSTTSSNTLLAQETPSSSSPTTPPNNPNKLFPYAQEI